MPKNNDRNFDSLARCWVNFPKLNCVRGVESGDVIGLEVWSAVAGVSREVGQMVADLR
jgi:hypothetical protein